MPSQPLTTEDLAILEKYLESRIYAVKETITAAYPDRAELLALLEKISHRVTQLEISKATLEGKASQAQVTVVLVISLVGLALTIIDMLWGA